MEQKVKVTGKIWSKWIIMFAVAAIILCLPTEEIFTEAIKRFAAVTAFIILWFAFEVTPNFVPALLLPVLYILSGIATPADVFAPWLSNTPWMILCALLIINIVDRIGLLNRGAYFVLQKTGSSYGGILYGLMIIGFLFNIVLCGMVYMITIPLAYGVCKTLNLGKSKTAVGIMFTGLLAANIPNFIIFSPGFIRMALGIVGPVTGLSIGWLQCLIQNSIFIPMAIVMVFVVKKMFPQDMPLEAKTFFAQKSKELGKMKQEEKGALMLLVILVIGLMTSGIHGMNIGWIFVLVTVAFYLPCFNIGIAEDLQRVNMTMVLFIASCMSIGQVSGVLDLGTIIANLVIPVINNMSSTMFLVAIWVLAVLLNLLLTPMAAIAAFSLPLVQIAMSMGVDPTPTIYVFMQGLDQVFMPYEYANYLFMFSFGIVSMKEFITFCSTKMLINIVYIALLAIPFWKLLGLL